MENIPKETLVSLYTQFPQEALTHQYSLTDFVSFTFFKKHLRSPDISGKPYIQELSYLELDFLMKEFEYCITQILSAYCDLCGITFDINNRRFTDFPCYAMWNVMRKCLNILQRNPDCKVFLELKCNNSHY